MLPHERYIDDGEEVVVEELWLRAAECQKVGGEGPCVAAAHASAFSGGGIAEYGPKDEILPKLLDVQAGCRFTKEGL